MAKGKKTGGRNIKKGERLKGAGAPKLSEETKAIRKFTSEEFIKRFEKYAFMLPDDTKKIIQDKKVSNLDIIFCRALEKAMAKGEYTLIKDCVERVLGKPKQSLDLGGDDLDNKVSEIRVTYK